MSIAYAAAGGVVTITLDRPEARNALDGATIAELLRALVTALAPLESGEPNPTRAIVIRANGPTFCAGGDFQQFRAMLASEPERVAAANREFGTLLEHLGAVHVPTVAIVAGAAIGGGVGLAAVCDFALARADATFRLPELTIGLPPAQVLPFVADRIGPGPALRAAITARTILADEALALGLVDEVASDDEDLEAALARTLDAIGNAEPNATHAAKRILAAEASALRSQVLDEASLLFARALQDGSAAEGLAAIAQRRKPRWAP